MHQEITYNYVIYSECADMEPENSAVTVALIGRQFGSSSGGLFYDIKKREARTVRLDKYDLPAP